MSRENQLNILCEKLLDKIDFETVNGCMACGTKITSDKIEFETDDKETIYFSWSCKCGNYWKQIIIFPLDEDGFEEYIIGDIFEIKDFVIDTINDNILIADKFGILISNYDDDILITKYDDNFDIEEAIYINCSEPHAFLEKCKSNIKFIETYITFS